MNAWAAQIEERIAAWIPRDQTVVAGISGGLDSMALAHLLASMAPRFGWRVIAAHFNHQLRGAQSDADEALVRQTAANLGIEFLAGRGDVQAVALREKLSTEMAARRLRYAFFSQCAAAHDSRFVTLAHHLDDQVELFFLRLFRGAGAAGLGGMKPSAPLPSNPAIRAVRPLLGERKAALAAFVRERGIAYSEDATNQSPDILRNRIRHELIPLLLGNYQPGLFEVIPRIMDICGAEAGAIEALACQWMEHPGGQSFSDLPAALQREGLRAGLIAAGLEPEFERVEWLRHHEERPASVAPGRSVLRDAQGRLRVEDDPGQGAPAWDLARAQECDLSRAGGCGFAGLEFQWEIADIQWGESPPQPGCEQFDADQVGRRALLRHWRPGDRFQPIGLEAPVKLQDLFVNLKVPREERHRRVVAVAESGGIFWVEGLRIGERFKLDKTTRTRLKWHWRR